MYGDPPRRQSNPFWDSSGSRGDERLVLDNWRHRQVMATSSPDQPNSLSTLDSTLNSLAAEMERNRSLAGGGSGSSNSYGSGAAYKAVYDTRAGTSSLGTGSTLVSLSDLQLQGQGFSGLPLESHPGAALNPQKSVAELSQRRREAIKAAFRRVDLKCQGWVTAQDVSSGLTRFSHLGPADQQRVVAGVSGSNPERISFSQFLGYYQLLGSTIERDRDFEELIRLHWGFAEVSDILDDMKNKFAMVGLAYAFRRTLERGGSPELTLQAFQEAVAQCGMHYSIHDLQRVFDAFDTEGGGSGPSSSSLEVLKLTAHITSAPRPQTPVHAIYGTAHLSEVGSTVAMEDHPSMSIHSPNTTSYPAALGYGGGYSGGSSSAAAPPPVAPAETKDDDRPDGPVPQAPPEQDHEDGTAAPPEQEPNPQTGYPTAPQAPLEEDDGEEAPEETQNDEDVEAPGDTGYGGGKPSGYGSYGSTSDPHTSSQTSVSAASNILGNASGQRRAVTVGINYLNMDQGRLAGCINDSDTFIHMLTQDFRFKVSDIRQLRDDHPQRMPTRKNITAALNWLVHGARAGDHLFFHYSGHGSQQRDQSHDEMDGQDETLVPSDFRSHGMISDDDLRRLIVLPLPAGVRLTVILDCCHSGTALDLPYKVLMNSDGKSADMKKKPAGRIPGKSEAEVVLISGCKDTQTSADIGAGSAGNDKAAGAMTTSFKTVIEKQADISYFGLLYEMRRFLKSRGFSQVPQLSSEQYLTLTDCFMPEAQPPYEEPPPSLRPPVRRALTIGINYLTLYPGRGRLSGCINDSETIVGILKDTYGFQDSQICRLRDDRQNMMPTKANMLAGLRWLSQGAANGDEFFLHFSGHGGQREDRTGDEKDGKDETLMPCDFQTAGQITDDELYTTCVANLPKGCRMWVILDCCHSGTALDLRYKVLMSEDGRSLRTMKSRRKTGQKSPAEVIMISGCKDKQTSADIQAGTMGAAKAAGAMTTAFRHCISQTISCEDLLVRMRQYLRRNNFQQVPQMSSEQFVQMDTSFVHYQAKKRNKRALPPVAVPAAGQPFLGPGVMPGSPMRQAQPAGGMPPPGMAGPAFAQEVQQVNTDDYVLGTRISALEQEIARLRATSPAPAPAAVGVPVYAQPMQAEWPPGSPGMSHLAPQFPAAAMPGQAAYYYSGQQAEGTAAGALPPGPMLQQWGSA